MLTELTYLSDLTIYEKLDYIARVIMNITILIYPIEKYQELQIDNDTNVRLKYLKFKSETAGFNVTVFGDCQY